jgi:hypothetical protein
VRFYLGTDDPGWLGRVAVPLFVSHRRLRRRPAWPRARAPWCLDSGAFSDIALAGEFTTTPAEYARSITRYREEIGSLEWAAPQDHMCEPWVLARSRVARTVPAAQAWSIRSVLELRDLGAPVIPVLQGQTADDYRRHADAYTAAGFELEAEPVVGLGSVCRRQNTDDIGRVVAALDGIRLHGFGVKSQGLERYGWMLESADSMAWSRRGRWAGPCPVRGVRNCAHCVHFALEWRERVVVDHRHRPIQLELEAVGDASPR